MTKTNFPKPDYKFWTKAETWSLNQAAFLLHGIDPHQTRSVRLAEYDIPREFEEVQKTYSLLRKIPWQNHYSQYYFPKLGIHPVAIIYEAHKKDLPLPKPLYNAISALPEYKKVTKQSIDNEIKSTTKQTESAVVTQENKADKKESLSTRERRNLLKAIGLLVRFAFDEKNKSSRYSNGDKLNAYQIAQKLLDKAQELGLEIEGLKSLDRKITEALEILEEGS